MMKSSLINTLLILLLISCKGVKSQTASDFMQLYTQSHSVKNKKILNIIDKKNELINNNSLYDVIVVKIDSISAEKQNIYIKASNFDLEKKYCFTDIGCERPNGYVSVNNIPVLLYGDLDVFFNKERKTKDILKSKKEELILLEMDGEYSMYEYQSYQIDDEIIENIIYKGEFSSRQVRKRLE